MAKRRGEIVPLKNLFNKYKTLLIAPQKTVELEMIRVAGELVGITLKESQVSYTPSTRTLAVNASGMIKQEIKLHYKDIYNEMRVRLGEKNSPKHIL